MSRVRKRRDGTILRAVEFRCPRCKAGILCSQDEAKPPPGKPVPLCSECLKEGVRSVLVRRQYASGPTDLHV